VTACKQSNPEQIVNTILICPKIQFNMLFYFYFAYSFLRKALTAKIDSYINA